MNKTDTLNKSGQVYSPFLQFPLDVDILKSGTKQMVCELMFFFFSAWELRAIMRLTVVTWTHAEHLPLPSEEVIEQVVQW